MLPSPMRRIEETIPLNPPSPRGIVREIPPSLEGGVPKGRGMFQPHFLFNFLNISP